MKKKKTLNSRILAIIAGGLLTLTFLLLTVSNVMPLWRSMENSLLSFTVGIWKICITVMNVKKCYAIPCEKKDDLIDDCLKMYAGRILFIATCVIAAISASYFFLVARKIDNLNQQLLLIMKILVFTSLLMGIIVVSMILYSTRIPQIEIPLGTSAYIGIIAVMTNLLGVGTAMLIQ